MTEPETTTSFTPARAVGVTFGLAVVLGVLDGALGGGVDTSHFALGARLALGITLLLFGAWFIKAFVSADLHDCTRATVHDMYRFAYVFMLVGLATLVMPFTAMHDTGSSPDSGPIRIINGCQGSFDAKAVAMPASAASSPWAQSPVPACAGTRSGQSYPLLVAVGGVVGAASAPENAASQATPVYAVAGGVVVPLYVIVLGFIGGAICLARKVPEYQKRTEPDFAGTTKELPLQAYEAREFVVFQVLQLVASPFIAIVAFYAFEPESIALAVAQAFFAGFSSEWVLLRIRAVVDGPGQVPTEAASQARADLAITVKDKAGNPVAGASVALSRTRGGTVVAAGTTDAAGMHTFKTVELGPLWVEASDALGGRKAGPEPHKVLAGRTEKDLILN